MAIRHAEEYRAAELARPLVEKIRAVSDSPVRLMEVCGTHTVSIFRHGLRALLPDTITLLSGPGCPVCVTAQGEIDAFVQLARRPDVIVATFGDLLRVPGSGSSLQQEKGQGADVRVVYSAMDALTIARAHSDKTVVFLGVGFETTVPTIAAAMLAARQMNLDNFCVYAAHKTVPVALAALMDSRQVNIDGFILPGHVSVIIGLDAYRPFFDQYQVPCVVTGFEPTDLLLGILKLVRQLADGRPALENAYPRAVSDTGNLKARQVTTQVFNPCDAQWRGIGTIAGSGLAIRAEFADMDAARRFEIPVQEVPEPRGCACGQVLTGVKTPPQCALFRKVCTPMAPVGPCMVSSEGTCAAYYRYHSTTG